MEHAVNSIAAPPRDGWGGLWEALGVLAWLVPVFLLLALAALWLAAFHEPVLAWLNHVYIRVRHFFRTAYALLIGVPLARLRGQDPPDVADKARRSWLPSASRQTKRAAAYARENGQALLFGTFSIFAIISALVVFYLLADVAFKGPPTTNEHGELLAYRVGLATLLAALTLPFLIHRARINERQTRVAEKGHITDRIIKATELLGATHEVHDENGKVRTAPTIEVRIGAIYTLERVAQESLADHLTIMETFAAYIRQNYRPPQLTIIEASKQEEEATVDQAASTNGSPADAAAPDAREASPPREDVLAALRAVLRRSVEQTRLEDDKDKPFRWQDVPLEHADLRTLFSANGPDDQRRWSLPFARLGGADLREANLWGANLRGADLREANLLGANLLGADLLGADLQRAKLQRANLRGTGLEEANLEEADLVRASLERAELRGANLEGANLQWVDLRGADLRGADLNCADLNWAYLQEANLQEANLQDANLERANLESADLRGANLEEANLERADLRGANLEEANLQDANLERANLQQADLLSANLKRASLARVRPGAELPQSLSQEQIESAFGDAAAARLAAALGLTPPDHWHPEELRDPEQADREWRAWAERRAKEA